MRKNGFERPFNGMQITTWIIFPILLIHFLMFLTPTLPIAISVPLTILFLIAAALSAYYGYITTKTDSMDHQLHQHLYGLPHPHSCQINNASESPETEEKYCWVCQTNVHPQSMHCKYCDKCVSHFDHHCMWLNTCVGSANYSSFFKTVIWTFIFLLIHIVTIGAHLILYFLGYENVKSQAGSWFGGAGANMILIGSNIGFLVFTIFCAFMVLQLLVFHLGLKREDITTYQYILRDTTKKREKMKLSNVIRERRVDELKNAGNGTEALCLKAGALKCCMSCDPVRRLVLQEMDQADTNEENGNNDRSHSIVNDNGIEDNVVDLEDNLKAGQNISTDVSRGDFPATVNGDTSPSNYSNASSGKCSGSLPGSEDKSKQSGTNFIKVTQDSKGVST